MTLWAHQSRGIVTLRTLSKKHRRILIVAPCGAGKTRFANEVAVGADKRGNRLLFVCHTQELLLQSVATFEAAGLRIGIIQGDHPFDADAPIHVGMAQTLQRRDVAMYTIIVIDEAHLHVETQAIDRIIAANPNAFVYGLTASPWRLDSRPMGGVYQAIFDLAKPSELLAQKILVPHRCFGPPGPDLSKVAIVDGDYNQKQLEAACNRPEITGDIASTYFLHRRPDGKFLSSLLFATSIAHSIECRDALRVLGVRAEHVDGNTNDEQRAELIRQLRDREIDVLCNVMILTAGFDYPGLEAIVMARPTQSLALFLQMAGRVLRASPETGKTEARIIDHVGNVMRHGFPLADREWTLEQAKKRAKRAEALPTLRTCPTCFAIFYTAPKCPECGHEFVVATREIETREGELHEIKNAFTRDQREAEFQRICRVAITARLGRKFVSRTYTKQFGMRPVGFTWPKELPENRASKRSELEHVARTRGYPSEWVDKAMGGAKR